MVRPNTEYAGTTEKVTFSRSLANRGEGGDPGPRCVLRHTCRFIASMYIDYICADKKKSCRVERRHWRHLIGLDFLFLKTPMFTPSSAVPDCVIE